MNLFYLLIYLLMMHVYYIAKFVLVYLLLTDDRKKVLTDPRLAKSKSPSSSVNRWYTGGDDEGAEVTPSTGAWYGQHLHLPSANELSPPLIGHDDASSVSYIF